MKNMKPFGVFVKDCQVSDTTGWRWRKRNWIQTINIAGRLYVTDEEADEFRKRAAAGEFAKQTPVPTNGREQ